MATWLNADAINALVDDLVLKLGDDAFAHDGRAHLYSGPSSAVYKKIDGYKFNNHARAKRRADNAKAVLIDDTKVGEFLTNFEGVGVYTYINSNPDIHPHQKKLEAAKIWRHASRLFVLSLWGEITTTVCGADKEGVYYQAEIPTVAEPSQVSLTMPEILRAIFTRRTKAIEAVNEVPLAKIRKLYAPNRYEGAQRLICLAEQRLDLRRARSDKSLEAYIDFHTGREQYRVDRYEVLKDQRPIYSQTPAERAARRQKAIQIFFANLQGASASWEVLSTPILPIAEAPDLQGFSHLSR